MHVWITKTEMQFGSQHLVPFWYLSYSRSWILSLIEKVPQSTKPCRNAFVIVKTHSTNRSVIKCMLFTTTKLKISANLSSRLCTTHSARIWLSISVWRFENTNSYIQHVPPSSPTTRTRSNRKSCNSTSSEGGTFIQYIRNVEQAKIFILCFPLGGTDVDAGIPARRDLGEFLWSVLVYVQRLHMLAGCMLSYWIYYPGGSCCVFSWTLLFRRR